MLYKLGARQCDSHICECVTGNGIAGPGAQKVAEALQVNTSLEELQLAWNCIVEHGAKALADALCVNTTLTALDMSANGIGMYGGASRLLCAYCTAESMSLFCSVSLLLCILSLSPASVCPCLLRLLSLLHIFIQQIHSEQV
jgi:hypothetical protein